MLSVGILICQIVYVCFRFVSLVPSGADETRSRQLVKSMDDLKSILKKKQALALDKEVELFRFLAFGASPEDLKAYFRQVAAGESTDEMKTKVKGWLKNCDTAFVPDTTPEAIIQHNDLLKEKLQKQIQLYEKLKEKGPFFGGKEQQ